MTPEVVWFKRDLRVQDHEPLFEASLRGPVLPLYVIEPSLLRASDFDPCHWTFLAASLGELRESLARLGQPLVIRVGEVVDVLRALRSEVRFERIRAHEETGNALTFARDKAVAKWARDEGVEFCETPNGGVVRRLRTRDGWSRLWEERMRRPIIQTPAHLQAVTVDQGYLPTTGELGLGVDHRNLAQTGGAAAGALLLDSFLTERGARYHLEMSSPVTAFDSCSRLSPHLAYGTISTRMIAHRLRAAEGSMAIRAFSARLHWRDHFMQKLEDEPAIEFQNFVRGFDGLRENDFNEDYFEAWKQGRTGYPMVDACMRCLAQTGWINFRMRAMLMSFASYHLWLHWRETGLHLAHLFVDYEPGIHWSQTQMQSGTTGMNTLRIYNPTKQILDHDPEGNFIRRWVPELEGVPAGLITNPWMFAPTYPQPVVEHIEAVKKARARLSEFRSQAGMRAEIQQVTKKHGSRKKSATGKRAPKRRSSGLTESHGD
jgi:deoxyribodipyrimidine photo-lyase